MAFTLPDLSNSGAPTTKQFLKSGIGWAEEPGGTDWVYLICDVIPAFDVTTTTEYTKLPLQTGASVADHAIDAPPTFNVTINQTNTPILAGVDGFDFEPVEMQIEQSRVKPGGLWAASQAITALFGGGNGTPNTMTLRLLRGSGSDRNRIDRLYRDLLQIQNDRRPIVLTAQGRNYTDYFITSLNYSRQGAAELGNFQLQCEKLNFAQSDLSTLTFDPAAGINTTTTDAGKQIPAEAAPELVSAVRQGLEETGTLSPDEI